MFKRTETPAAVFDGLQRKFDGNLAAALSCQQNLCAEAELMARVIPAVAVILSGLPQLTESHKALICIFDEIFADTVTSIYLAACALDKPAQMMLRRSLELGVASVYLWDLPHLFWAWKTHDEDLNFNQMIEHLTTPGLKTMIKRENLNYKGNRELLNVSEVKALYRTLSNVIHGKISTFESVLADRFEHTERDWEKHLANVLEVEKLLIELWCSRFEEVAEGLSSSMPQLRLKPAGAKA
jgi:hypothetical protein